MKTYEDLMAELRSSTRHEEEEAEAVLLNEANIPGKLYALGERTKYVALRSKYEAKIREFKSQIRRARSAKTVDQRLIALVDGFDALSDAMQFGSERDASSMRLMVISILLSDNVRNIFRQELEQLVKKGSL